jgi:hypothetical protein
MARRAYVVIEDFKAGLDTRRLPEAAAPGSLQVLQNAHINRGGEIVLAKAWDPFFALPKGTFGYVTAKGKHFVFGSIIAPSGLPTGVTYQRLSHPTGAAMTAVVSATVASGKPYVVAEYDDGTRHHFYDGEIVEDWYLGVVQSRMVNVSGIARGLVEHLQEDPVVLASFSGAVITLVGREDNEAFTVTASSTNAGGVDIQGVVVVLRQAAGASQPQIVDVVLQGTFDPGDLYTITVSNTTHDNTYGASFPAGALAATVLAHKSKIYAGASTDLLFSGVLDPLAWRNNGAGGVANTGAGVIDVGSWVAGANGITALGVYQDFLAVFTRNNIQAWFVDTDETNNYLAQIVDNTGTIAPKTVKSFGNLDLFYLADSGFRSLRPRDSSNVANVSDVGTPIDDIVIKKMEEVGEEVVAQAASVFEPKDGRYIASLGDVLYVFTYFSSSDISAWSTYNPGLVFSDFGVLDGRLYGRAGDVIYLLGGQDNDVFSKEEAVIELPYLDVNKIAHWKSWVGLDLVARGTWDVYANTNPRFPDEWVKVATVTGSTFTSQNVALQQYAPMLKLRFTHRGKGVQEAVISRIAVHYEVHQAG